jgi:acyl-coenzyme A synthetase/AMP-(fatty) acid ligase
MGFKKYYKIKFIFGKDKKNFRMKKKIFQIKNEIVNNSSKSLFTLFTSGSTGVPKGITHSTGGYLLYSKLTCQKQFGINKNQLF